MTERGFWAALKPWRGSFGLTDAGSLRTIEDFKCPLEAVCETKWTSAPLPDKFRRKIMSAADGHGNAPTRARLLRVLGVRG